MQNPHPRAMGQFVWNTTTDQWYWNATMFDLHGYPHDAVKVTGDLVLEHKHDSYRAFATSVLAASAAGDQRFSNFHCIIDANGRQRTVLTVGESHTNTPGSSPSPRFARGFMVDVTQDVTVFTPRAVRQAREGMAPIQQSMGLLMGSFGLTDDAAFAVLTRVSQHHNVKVRDLARGFIDAARSGATDSQRDLWQILVDQATTLAAHARHLDMRG